VDPTVSPTENGLYYNRNRFYDPHLGRFIQRDPNATALPIITALFMNGDALHVLLSGFDATGHYTDGMNLYLYQRANPVDGRDPSGLAMTMDWDPIEAADDAIFGMQAEKAAWADAAYGFGLACMRAGAIVALECAVTAVVPGAGFALAAYGVGTSIDSILRDGLTVGNGVSLVANAVGVGLSARAAARSFRGAYRDARALYKRGFRKTFGLPGWRGLREVNWGHIFNFHTVTGKGYIQSLKSGGKKLKTAWPASMSQAQIMKAVEFAYKSAKIVYKQAGGPNVQWKLRGFTSGKQVEMWYIPATKVLRTAYPLAKCPASAERWWRCSYGLDNWTVQLPCRTSGTRTILDRAVRPHLDHDG
jgi:RHS repeat-associated protein